MQLTFFAEGPPARASLSPVSEAASTMLVVISCSSLLKLLADIGPRGWSGRTSPASFQATEDETLRAFWESSVDGGSPHQKTDGEIRDMSRGSKAHTASHGECVTLNSSEWNHTLAPSLRDEGVSSLSDILETGDVPQRFYLSAKACRGILRRAAKRGKVLPPQLQAALQAVADSEPTSAAMGD